VNLDLALRWHFASLDVDILTFLQHFH
jgi:hypothetical protein